MINMADLKGKRFLITGGAGFIGSNFCAELIGKGAEVIVYDNLSSGSYELIHPLTKSGKLTFINANILETDKLNGAFKKFEPHAIIHLAANYDVRRGFTETDLDLREGLLLTYNVLECARQNDLKDIIFSSSSTVYGAATVKPTPEDYGPMKPVSLYGASKLASEGYITAFSHLYGMRYFIFRFANVVGNNMSHGIVPDLISKLAKDKRTLKVLGNGKQSKSYIDVMDCVGGMMHAYAHPNSKENIYNLATNDQISAGEIAKLVVKMTGSSAKIVYSKGEVGWPGDISNVWLSNKKIKESGYKMRHASSRDAITNAIKGCLAARS
jgi:UDP-glucose 4-epimerase